MYNKKGDEYGFGLITHEVRHVEVNEIYLFDQLIKTH